MMNWQLDKTIGKEVVDGLLRSRVRWNQEIGKNRAQLESGGYVSWMRHDLFIRAQSMSAAENEVLPLNTVRVTLLRHDTTYPDLCTSWWDA